MNFPALFSQLRKLSGSLSQVQVDSTNAILESCEKHGVTDPNQVAYILATGWHEARLKPVREVGLGKGHPYGIADPITHQTYYGRGNVSQITWKANYATFAKILGIDLLNNPDLALQIDIGAEIGVIGMKGGLFTGVGLSRYFNSERQDPVNARKIINGKDCAQLIAGYYEHILDGINGVG